MRTSGTDPHRLLQALRVECLEVARMGGRLPDEVTLAEENGVSRAMLREALARLEMEGLITRRQRVGIRVNPDAAGIGSRFDRQLDYAQTLRDAGYEPSIRLLEVRLATLGETGAAVFVMPVDTPCVITRKVWLADGRPTMTALDRIPAPGLRDIDGINGTDNVFDLARQLVKTAVQWEVTRPSASLATDELSNWLHTPVGAPLLTMTTLGVSANGQRLFDAIEHHIPGVVDFGLIRTVHA